MFAQSCFFRLKVMRWKKNIFGFIYFLMFKSSAFVKKKSSYWCTHKQHWKLKAHLSDRPHQECLDFSVAFFQIQHWKFIVLYNLNIMQRADYVYANLLSAIIPCAGCMDFTDYSVYYSFWLISPAHLSSPSAFIISPIWLAAYFFHDLFYSNCKIVVKCSI